MKSQLLEWDLIVSGEEKAYKLRFLVQTGDDKGEHIVIPMTPADCERIGSALTMAAEKAERGVKVPSIDGFDEAAIPPYHYGTSDLSDVAIRDMAHEAAKGVRYRPGEPMNV